MNDFSGLITRNGSPGAATRGPLRPDGGRQDDRVTRFSNRGEHISVSAPQTDHMVHAADVCQPDWFSCRFRCGPTAGHRWPGFSRSRVRGRSSPAMGTKKERPDYGTGRLNLLKTIFLTNRGGREVCRRLLFSFGLPQRWSMPGGHRSGEFSQARSR